MAPLSEIHWPVLRFGRPDCVMLKCEEPADLTRATFISLPVLNAMDEYFVVDSRGDVFELSDAGPRRQIGRMATILMRLTNPSIDIEYGRVERTKRVSLDDLKALIRKELDEEPSYWEELDDLDSLRSRVKDCSSLNELIQLF